MESLNFHNIKVEKVNAVLRYKKCERVTTLFRFIELCIFIVIISRSSTQLPFTFKLSIEYFKGLGVTLISPRFVFVLGNVIVIILFLKSRQSSAKDGSTNNVKIDLYDEYKHKCSMNKGSYCEQNKKQRKQIILVEQPYCEQIRRSRKQSILVRRQLVEKKLHCSHSDSFTTNMPKTHDEKPRKELIRSATIGYRKLIVTDSVKSAEGEMSNEEFRRTVEDFIARQQRFLREEEFSAVVSTQTETS
ncbi:uncharacterized protein LOC132644722 [Lycium barbarum]|uniref:uncharacterized protein LOC132644722 n=1 Tax=Lycium barbarum TaxID=112863 RepID=UPI00293F6212|nr:uncharacterized protein LOC132644722 [Lycium barbarum]